jgi:hypothetical protein
VLEGEIAAEREGLKGLAGPEKWATLQLIAALVRQLGEAKKDLNNCVLKNAPGYETDVVIYDLSGTVGLPTQGRLWELSPPSGQREIEARTVQGGRITFVHGGASAGASIGISINEAPNPTFPGPLFRSGALSSLPAGAPANPGGLIEIGVLSAIPFPAAALNTAVTAAPLPGLPAGLTIATRATTLGAGTATLVVTGTFVIAEPILGTVTLPFTYTLTFSIVPSMNMNNVAEICVVVHSGPGALTTPIGGLIGFMFGFVAPTVEPTITGTVVPAVQAALNAGILSAAPSGLGRPLRPGIDVISMRRVAISPGTMGSVTFFPAMGAYGGIFP